MPGIAVKMFWAREVAAAVKAIKKRSRGLLRKLRRPIKISLDVRGNAYQQIRMAVSANGSLLDKISKSININGVYRIIIQNSIDVKLKIKNWRISILRFMEEDENE